MSIVKETNKYLALKEDEPPPKKLITEGDILIKNLAEKQRKTKVSLKDYLHHQKSFERVSEHISLTSCHSGTTSLDQFKNVVSRIEDIEYLRSAGLENEDIRLLWDYQQNGTHGEHKKVERSVLENKVKKISEMLLTYRESQSNDTKSVESKRSLSEEILFAAKPNSTVTKLLKFAINNEQREDVNFVSSMDNLKELERDRFSYLDDEKLDPKKVQRRLRNINARINNIGKNGDESKICHKKQTSDHLFVEDSKWDVEKVDLIEKPKEKDCKTYTCNTKNYYTIKNGEIVKLNEEQTREKDLEINKRKLSIDEIKTLPKFKNYNPGQPSNVLYLKNMPKNITEKDLKEIFIDFPEIAFKIMTGRMKGQVFVTFPVTNKASEAFDKINGLLIDNKPVIIEYGKKGNT